MKLSNPPPKSLGVFGGVTGSGWPGAEDGLPSGVGTSQAADDAARSAVTAEFVATVIGMVVIVSAALCVVLRRANLAGGGESRRVARAARFPYPSVVFIERGLAFEVCLLCAEGPCCDAPGVRHSGVGGVGELGGVEATVSTPGSPALCSKGIGSVMGCDCGAG